MITTEDFIKYWQLDLTSKPYIQPKDRELVDDNYNNCEDYDDYMKKIEKIDDKKFHLNLLPSPYEDNLRKAKVILLMNNPGFAPIDYYAEYKDKSYRKSLKKNLKQEIEDENFPFLSLNPKFLWTGTGQYWSKKLKDCIAYLLKEDKNIKNYEEAVRRISRVIAVVELIPYHSKYYKYLEMESVEKVVDYVNKCLVKQAKKGNICLICLRAARDWKLAVKTDSNIIIYPGEKARAASLSKDSCGGKKIIDVLKSQKI